MDGQTDLHVDASYTQFAIAFRRPKDNTNKSLQVSGISFGGQTMENLCQHAHECTSLVSTCDWISSRPYRN